VISTNDALLLRFKTDSTIVSKGFSASYIAVESMNPSVEYSSLTDEDDVDLAFHKNKKNKKKKNKSSSSNQTNGDGDDDDSDGGDEDDDDEDDDDEDMLAVKSP
jgi:hypothetical protein